MDPPASVVYRYRRWDLGDGQVVVCRTEHDAVDNKGRFVSVHALNECDSKALVGTTDYRLKLGAAGGALLGTEIRNNKFKIARWTARALLAGSEIIKIGFVTRTDPKKREHHTILGVQTHKVTELGTQTNVRPEHAWGVLKLVLTRLMALDAGTYILLKDPMLPMLRVYEVPGDELAQDMDDGGGGSDEER